MIRVIIIYIYIYWWTFYLRWLLIYEICSPIKFMQFFALSLSLFFFLTRVEDEISTEALCKMNLTETFVCFKIFNLQNNFPNESIDPSLYSMTYLVDPTDNFLHWLTSWLLSLKMRSFLLISILKLSF